MTATPIPRSLTMSAYADLDTSVIDELPPGRQKIKTVALSNNRRDELIAKIKKISKLNIKPRYIFLLSFIIKLFKERYGAQINPF